MAMENLHFQTVWWWLIIENVKPSKWILFFLEKHYPLIGIICGWTNSCTSSYVSSIPFLFTVFNQTPTNIKKTVPYSSAVVRLPIFVLVIPTTSTPEVLGCLFFSATNFARAFFFVRNIPYGIPIGQAAQGHRFSTVFLPANEMDPCT